MKILSKFFINVIIVVHVCFIFPATAGLKKGDIAPAFTLTALSGGSISLQDLTRKGHVMLVFWESECVYCFMHIGEFNALHQKYKDAGLTIAAINFLGEHEDAIRQYTEQHNIDYLMLTDRGKSVDVASDYKVIGSPTIVVISSENRILYYGHQIPDIKQWVR